MLRAEGARVAVTDRDSGALDAEAHLDGDLLDATFRDALPGRAAAALRRRDILVTNAGMMREGTADAIPPDDWHLQLQINLTAPFLLVCRALPLLRAARGAIVNVGAIDGLGSNPRNAVAPAGSTRR